MTEEQRQLSLLINQYENHKEQMKVLKAEMQALMLNMNEGDMFQDGEGLVYKIEKPTGTFIAFDPITYVRTKRPSERKGSLSKKEAQEAGFTPL